MVMMIISLWSFLMWLVDGSIVLDPALYLSPSPPMTSSSDMFPGELWSRAVEIRVERATDDGLSVVPLEKTLAPTLPTVAEDRTQEAMETAQTFWPVFRTTSSDHLQGINFPLTFRLSGTYGSYGGSSGVISSNYGSMSGDGLYGKSALAGSSYGSYSPGFSGVRIFGGSNVPSWSGWGNGKWGHYGKG